MKDTFIKITQMEKKKTWGQEEMNKAEQEKIWANFKSKEATKIGEGGQAYAFQHKIYEDIAIVYYGKQQFNEAYLQKQQQRINQIIDGQNKHKFSLIIRTYGIKEFPQISGKKIIGLIQEKAKGNLTQFTFQMQEQYSLMIEIAQGVKQLHDALIIHRDLKPSNIFVMQDGIDFHIKLGDIGVLKIIEQSSQQHTPIQSVNYSAPELSVRNGVHTKYVDIYSLGCLFFYILTKTDPILNRNNDLELNEITGGMRALIEKMTHKNPTERHSIDQVLEILEKNNSNKIQETQQPITEPNHQSQDINEIAQNQESNYETQEAKKKVKIE